MFPTDAGRTAGTRPLQCRGVALGHRTAKAPARGLSALPSMASGLAVYASSSGLPRLDAKLASSRWSDAPGRAFHPQGPSRRFQSAFVISSSFSNLAWRNRCVLRALHLDANLRRCVRPERATNIVLSALVDVTSAPNTAAQTQLGV